MKGEAIIKGRHMDLGYDAEFKIMDKGDGKGLFALINGKWRFAIFDKSWGTISVMGRDKYDWNTFKILEISHITEYVDKKKYGKGNKYLKKGLEEEKHIFNKLLEYNKIHNLQHDIKYNGSGCGGFSGPDVDIIVDNVVGLECCSMFLRNKYYYLSIGHKKGIVSWIEKQKKYGFDFLFLCWRNSIKNNKIEFLDLNDKFLNIQYFRRNGKELKGDLNYKKVKSRIFSMGDFFKKIPGGFQTFL